MVPAVATAGGTYQNRTHIRGGQAELDVPGKQRAAEELLVLSSTEQFPPFPHVGSGPLWEYGSCSPTFLPSHVSGISLSPWGRSHICNAQALKGKTLPRSLCLSFPRCGWDVSPWAPAVQMGSLLDGCHRDDHPGVDNAEVEPGSHIL